jgi:ABC-type proline/glycine betaine transport system permease subunit
VEHGSAQALIYILVVGAIVYFRLLRPVRLSAARLWVGPALLVILTAFLVWESVQGHASLPIVAGAIVLGFVLGFPLGLLRGRHTKVEKTSNPRVLIVQPSIIPLAIWGVAFVVRFGIRYFLPHAGPVAFEASDGALAFAVGSIIGARYVIAQHFRELAAP